GSELRQTQHARQHPHAGHPHRRRGRHAALTDRYPFDPGGAWGPGGQAGSFRVAERIRLATTVTASTPPITASETPVETSGTAIGSPPPRKGRVFSASACRISLTPMNPRITAS